MSGGMFDFINYRLDEFAKELEDIVAMNGKEIPYRTLDEERKRSWSIYHDGTDCTEENYANDPYQYSSYTIGTIEDMRHGLLFTKLASVYLRNIDFLLSNDYGEETFNESLVADLGSIDIPDEMKEVLCHV